MSDETTNSTRTYGNTAIAVMPRSKSELLARRLNQKANNFNDIVEQIYLDNAEDDILAHWLEAMDNDDSHTGKLAFDQNHAAERLIELSGNTLAGAKSAQVLKSLNVVLKRYGLTPQQRLEQLNLEAEARAADNLV